MDKPAGSKSTFDDALVCWFGAQLIPRMKQHRGQFCKDSGSNSPIGRGRVTFKDLKDGKLLLLALRFVLSQTELDVEEGMSTGGVLSSVMYTLTSNWGHIRNYLAHAYEGLPTVIDEYDAANIDSRVRIALEVMLSIAVHGNDREHYVNKIMELRQETQHMLMIAIQRNYIPTIFEAAVVSPYKSPPKHDYRDRYASDEEGSDEGTGKMPECRGEREGESSENNRNTDNNRRTSCNHTVPQRHFQPRRRQKHSLIEAGEESIMMTPQKFFQTAAKTPYGKRSPPQNLVLKIKTQRKLIDELEQKVANEQRVSQTKTKNYEHSIKVQHELASVIEQQNDEISELRSRLQKCESVETENACLRETIDDLEGYKKQWKACDRKLNRALKQKEQLHSENKEMRNKLLEHYDRQMETEKMIALKNELEAKRNEVSELQCAMETDRVKFNRIEFELKEADKALTLEKNTKREVQQRYHEHMRESSETTSALEQALENLNEDFQDQKGALRRQLDLLRVEHKSAIRSFENAFRAKLAEVCSQRDEYAEAVESLREELAGSMGGMRLATSPSSASVCKYELNRHPLFQRAILSFRQVESTPPQGH